MTTKIKTRVMIAAASNSITPISEALANDFELSFASTMADAMSWNYAQTQVIVCGLYFDESRMFDFLRYAKVDTKTRDIPFVCVSAVDGGLNHTFRQGVEIACKALGAADFIELAEWKRRLGMAEAHTRFRGTVARLATERAQ